MPLVIGLFKHEEGAESAVTYLEEIGVDRRKIEIKTYRDTAGKIAGHTPEEGKKGGIEEGKIVRADVPQRYLVRASEAFLNLARKG